MRKVRFSALITATAILTSCGVSKSSYVDGNTGASRQAGDSHPTKIERPVDGSASTMAHARIYKISGDYADNVPVGYNSRTGQIVSYPAPTDLRDAEPVSLRDGYYLDRRGVGSNTAFTTFTYSEYAALPAAPDAAQLKEAIIAGARVTELVEMPFAYSPGCAATCDSLISEGLPGCKKIFTAPTLAR